MYGTELAGCYLNSMEPNVHDRGNIVSKDSAIRQIFGRRHCLKASHLSFGDDIFCLKLLHSTVDGFLSNSVSAESELVCFWGITEL